MPGIATATAAEPSPFGRIAVMGAGAVGCYFGAVLARAGHEVVLIGRAAHVQVIRREGLRLESRGTDERIRVDADTDAGAVTGARLVLFSVKSTDTESAAAQMRPALAPDALVLALQNGVDNAERLRAVLGQTVAAAAVYVAVEMAGPGHVVHHGRGEVVVEPVAGSDEVVRLFNAAGIAAERSGDVRGALWAKLIVNCAYNALSAITGLPYGALVQGDGITAVMRDVVAECRAVAAAEGVEPAGDVDASVQRIAETMPSQRSSTAHDLARGKPSEIDHLNGFIVRRGEALGVPTPVNRTLQALVRLIENHPEALAWRHGQALDDQVLDVLRPSRR